ncbi:hypothetical protein HanIR_Chr12g0602851 [Helianthus annuus]|nr:hypothetical protein HanIR_Chr12g0602851 [Helianthus annuus]
MADSVDVAPPDSWDVADVDADVSRLMLSLKRKSNNSSEINSDLLAPVRSSSGGVLEDLVNTVDQFLRRISFRLVNCQKKVFLFANGGGSSLILPALCFLRINGSKTITTQFTTQAYKRKMHCMLVTVAYFLLEEMPLGASLIDGFYLFMFC